MPAKCETNPPLPFDPPEDVKCPCECGGILRSDGRNGMDTLTFLMCGTCRCCYRAEDRKEEVLGKKAATDDDDDIEIGR